MPPSPSVAYLVEDLPRTLFPLTTTRVIAETCGDSALAALYKSLTPTGANADAFQPQQRVHAAKKGFHVLNSTQ